MKFVKMFLALVGLAVLFVFVRDNTATVVVEFWEYATPEIELFLVLIITFVLGMIVASFGSTLKIMKLKRQLKNAEKTRLNRVKRVKKTRKINTRKMMQKRWNLTLRAALLEVMRPRVQQHPRVHMRPAQPLHQIPQRPQLKLLLLLRSPLRSR